jgi:pimeloyl-ACP methyl ester carboxylesterase
MAKNLDGFLRSMQSGAIEALETVHKGTTVALEAVQKSASASVGAVHKSGTVALGAVQKSAIVSIEAIEWLTEIKGRPLAVLNGVVGDTLAAQNSKLAIEMSLIGKKQGGRLCIFVHGLCASEASWQFSEDATKTYGSLLEKDCGYAPIYVRYNSGLHISTNGQLLAQLVSELCKNSPASTRGATSTRGGSDPIQEIIFVGHSIGGLVIRSACHYAQKANAPWIKKISKIFLLATPHHGNDYEKLGNLISTVLNLLPIFVTKGIAKLANKRSASIKDLRFGYLLDEDWLDQDPDDLWQDNRHPVPLLEGVNYYIIAGSLAKESDNIFTQYFGDGMVPTHTAAGRSFSQSKTIPFSRKHFKIIKGVSHAGLTRHLKVYQQIRRWCRKKNSSTTAF